MLELRQDEEPVYGNEIRDGDTVRSLWEACHPNGRVAVSKVRKSRDGTVSFFGTTTEQVPSVTRPYVVDANSQLARLKVDRPAGDEVPDEGPSLILVEWLRFSG